MWNFVLLSVVSLIVPSFTSQITSLNGVAAENITVSYFNAIDNMQLKITVIIGTLDRL